MGVSHYHRHNTQQYVSSILDNDDKLIRTDWADQQCAIPIMLENIFRFVVKLDRSILGIQILRTIDT